MVEIISIGDEILIGQTINTNAGWMGKSLNDIGLNVERVLVIPDESASIIHALDNLLPSTKLVLLTGGLGPTKDDLTKKTLTQYFGGVLEYQPHVFAAIETLFAKFGRKPNHLNKEQAFLPTNAEHLPNKIGTAWGMKWEKNGVFFYSLPGVPHEMKYLMEHSVLPTAQKVFANGAIVHRTIMTQGIPESELAERIASWEDNLPQDIKLAYLPSPGKVKLRMTAKGPHKEVLTKQIDEQAEKLLPLIAESVYGENDLLLEEAILNLFKEKKITLATAESCTGGGIGARLTSIPGSSEYFLGGIIAYSNAVKIKHLSVDEKTIENYGAVSQEVVEQMANRVLSALNSDFAIAVSGIAGPGGGSQEKPVGTVWIALAGKGEVISEVFKFGNKRELIVNRTITQSLAMMFKFAKKLA